MQAHINFLSDKVDLILSKQSRESKFSIVQAIDT